MPKSLSFPLLIDLVSSSLFGVSSLVDTDGKKPSKLVIGYSGGLDSSVLLYLVLEAARLKGVSSSNITAVHCHHGISSNADCWLQHCQKVAKSIGVKCAVHYLDLKDNQSEQYAREARYQVFAQYMEEGSVLLLGHHANDQIETTLFRLFRGSGLKGLSGIPRERGFGKGNIVRPLMDVSKDNLKKLAMEQSIAWIEDDSNGSDVYDRNYIRNSILPLVNQRWPHAEKSILQASEVMADAQDLLSEYADELALRLDSRDEVFGFSLSIDLLLKLSDRQANLVLRRLFFKICKKRLNMRDLEQVRRQFLQSQENAQPSIDIDNITLRRFKSRLYFLTDLPTNNSNNERLCWDAKLPLTISFGSRKLGDLSLIEGDISVFEVGFRQGGERLNILSKAHSQSLKKCLHEKDLAPWLRSLLPIIYSDNDIVAVADIFRCTQHRFKWVWHLSFMNDD